MIKKILLITLFAICIAPILRAQQKSYDFLAKQYCKELEKINFIDKSPKEINFTFFDAGKHIRKEYHDTIAKIDSLIKATNDTLSRAEINYIFSKQYLVTMINNCDCYLKVNRLLIDSCPADNKSLQYITLKINSYFILHPNLPAQEVLSKSLDITGEVLTEIKDQIEVDYNEGLSNPNLVTDIRLYLLHKSDAYFKAWLINQSQHLFHPQKTVK